MANVMKAGIWIDNKRAVIVLLNNGQQQVQKVYSGIESRKRVEGEGKQYTRMGKQYFSFEKKEEEKIDNQLKTYFREVINVVADAKQLLIMGPASAKVELEKEIRLSGGGASNAIKVMPEGRLTENQIVAAVKKFFSTSS